MKIKTIFGRLALAGCAVLAATQIGRAQPTLTDIGATAPTPGTYDVAQLLYRGSTGSPGGLNYYWDNATPNGATFYTGANAGGYVMNSFAIKTLGGGGNNGNGNGSEFTAQPFDLFIYSVSGTTATLVTEIVSQSTAALATQGDWMQMTGFTLPLLPNQEYAYTFRRTSAGYENLGWTNGIANSVGQACEIPTGGGTITFTSSTTADGTFDAGLILPTALTVGAPSASVGNPLNIGASVTLTAGTVVDNAGNGTYTYQWQTDGGTGGTLTNIPGQTAKTLSVNTTGFTPGGNYNYQVVVTDSVAATATSAEYDVQVEYILAMTAADNGSTAPVPGTFDAYQLVGGANTSGGLNYYNNAGTPSGQTFTTGANAQGYYLSSVSILTGFNTGNTAVTNALAYDVFIYNIGSLGGTTASQIADCTNLAFAFTNDDWLTFSFPSITLLPNTTYAYTWHTRANSYAGMTTDPGTTDLYASGQICQIPIGGGTVVYGGATDDATFDVGLVPVGVNLIVNVPTATPSTVYALSPVVLHDTVSTVGTYTYQWLTDDGTGANPPNYITIPGATTTNITVYPQDLLPGAGLAAYTTNFYFTAADTHGNNATSSVVTVTVNSATVPLITGPTPTNLSTYVGDTITYTVTEKGTVPITNQWLANTTGSYVAIGGQTNLSVTLANVQTAATGSYEIAATNVFGNSNSAVSLTVLADPAGPNPATQKYATQVYTNVNAWAYWRLNETINPLSSTTYKAYDYSGHGFDATYGTNVLTDQTGPTPSADFVGFDSGELAVQTTYSLNGSELTVPNLNLGLTNTNITFMCWINGNAAQNPSTGLLFHRNGSDASGFGFGNTNDALGYTWNNNSASTYAWNSGLIVADYQWNFVAYVITPSNATIYLGNLNNGTTNFYSAVNNVANIGENFTGGTTMLAADPLYPNTGANSRVFNGLLCEAVLLTNALSTAQVQSYFETSLGITALAPTVLAATATPSPTVYSGQNVILSSQSGGTAPLTNQWQISSDGITYSNIPGANTSTYIASPFIVGTYYYQLAVTNAVGSAISTPVQVTYSALPSAPPGLWTVNFQITNNLIDAGQAMGQGAGIYVGRGAVGTGMYWNPVPFVLTVQQGNDYDAETINNITDFADDGVTHTGIITAWNNGGTYNLANSPLAYPQDIDNLLDQSYRTYYSPNALQFTKVPAGTYNLVIYSGDGDSINGLANYGSTFVVYDAQNGNQTNSTYEPTFIGGYLSQGANFVIFTNVHIPGALNVDVDVNAATTGGTANLSATQLQLVSYDPPTGSFTGAPTNAFVGQTVTFTPNADAATQLIWNFGDATLVTNNYSPAAIPTAVTHGYAAAGTYTVSLTETGPGGGPVTTTSNAYINVVSLPTVTSANLANNQFVMSGSSGIAGDQYRILTTTNLTLPFSSWTVVYTNTFGAGGTFAYTNSPATNKAGFYILISP